MSLDFTRLSLSLSLSIYLSFSPLSLFRRYFGSYAVISGALARWVHGEDEDKDAVGVGPKKDKPLPVGAALVAGGLSGFCYWLSCYPMDVIKNKIQAAPDTKVPLYPR